MSKKIIILEDDEATAELIKFYLQEEGFQVAVSTRGRDFIAKVAEYKPDLITLDVLLPDADGFNIFKELQQNKQTKNIPVIFITVKENEKEKGIKMGLMSPYNCNNILSYPFDYDNMRFKIISYYRRDKHGYISMLLSQQRM